MFKGQTCLILLWSNAARAILCVSESPLVLLVDVRSTRTVIRLVKNTRSFATRGIKNGTIDKLFEWFAVTADLIIEQRRSIPFPRSVPKLILICNSYKIPNKLTQRACLNNDLFHFFQSFYLECRIRIFQRGRNVIFETDCHQTCWACMWWSFWICTRSYPSSMCAGAHSTGRNRPE